MTTFLGCIADDFTGATDLAGLLARSGIKVSLRMGIPDENPKDTAAIEVIALKCRTAPVEEAVAECRAALSWLKKARCEPLLLEILLDLRQHRQGQYRPCRRSSDERHWCDTDHLLPGIP